MTALLITIGVIAAAVWAMLYSDKVASKARAEKAENERLKQEAEQARKQKEMEDALMEAKRLIALGEVLKQAKIMGDDKTIEKVNNMEYDSTLPEERSDGAYTSIYDGLRIFKIAGMKYRGNLSAYIGEFKGVLVPDPKNEYDPMAIMVKCEDGKHLGYIKEEQTNTVRWLVDAEQPLGEDKPTLFNPYKIVGWIEEKEDEIDGHKFYDGTVYVKKKE